MGTGYGDGPTCIYDMIPCDMCNRCNKLCEHLETKVVYCCGEWYNTCVNCGVYVEKEE